MIVSLAPKRWRRLGELRWTRSAKFACAAVATIAYFLAAYWLEVSHVPDVYSEIGPSVTGEKIHLIGPFTKYLDSDFAVSTERYGLFDSLADSEDDNTRSTIELYENNKRIGPAHSKYIEIARLGLGRFSHWRKNGTVFIFSSSDNSDPRTNGRAYWVVKPGIPDPQ